jgi:hypothetical protein
MPCLKRKRRNVGFDVENVPEAPADFARYLDDLIRISVVPMIGMIEKIFADTKVTIDDCVMQIESNRHIMQKYEVLAIKTIGRLKAFPTLRSERMIELLQRLHAEIRRQCDRQDRINTLYESKYGRMMTHLPSATRYQRFLNNRKSMISNFLDTIGAADSHYVQIRNYRHNLRLLSDDLSGILIQGRNILEEDKKIVQSGIGADEDLQQSLVSVEELKIKAEAVRRALSESWTSSRRRSCVLEGNLMKVEF